MDSIWPMVDSVWHLVLIVVIVGGVTASHLGGVVLERVLPQFGNRVDGDPRLPDRGEVAALRRELNASHQGLDRLHQLEQQVDRIQEQLHFLESLLEGNELGELHELHVDHR